MSKYSDVYCSLNDRAWTELVTNTTCLSDIQAEKHLTNLIKPGCFPQSCLPAFLHEAVHHWCFHSPVGTTLALLQMRARRRALKLNGGNTDSAFDLVEDLIRYEMTVELMRPLAEGLSLYAEFDATPKTESQSISTLFSWLILLFTDPIETATYEFSDKTKASPLYNLICSMRLSESYSRRKSNLLMSTMSCSEGGYLPGYITVKNLWGYACSQAEQFADTELFMMFLRAFFYDDFGLVAELLEPSVSEVEAVNRIATYVQERFGTLLQMDLKSEAISFQRKISSLNIGQREPEAFRLGTEQQLWELGNRRLQALLAELDEETKADEFSAMLAQSDLWTLAQRDVMWIGSAEVKVQISEAGWVVVSHGDSFLCAGAALEGANPGSGNGYIDIYLSLSGGYKAVAVSLDHQMALLFTSGMMGQELRQQFRSYRTNRAHVDKAQQALSEFVRLIASSDAASVLMEHVKEFIPSMVNEIYGSKALLWVPENSVASYLKIMEDDGFLPIVDYNVSLLKNLVQVSLAASLCQSWDGLVELFNKKGIDLNQVVDDLSRHSQQHGIPLLIRDHGILLSLV